MNDPNDAKTVVGPSLPASAPKKVGHFVLKQVIASGGMGTVYLAVQEHPRRTVALKIMKPGIVSESTLRRFDLESQVLGRLRHPNIAQVYEAGTHDDGAEGVPYFAMEYIPNARPIDQYCREKKRESRAILKMFVKVCDAVHHGHQKGVIHRDLKPENILVDSSGSPRIIDFGVARSTDADVARTTIETSVGQIVGTVQYMSPEQCEADPHDLDTRSDVYSLGVVLYELLCGTTPYDVSQAPIYEAARIIREVSPARPSTVDRHLRGDVETITLTALEKDRDRRYQSANALAKDIQRYLRNEPIDARPPSLTYQISVFARRHRGVFASMLVIAGVLVATTTLSLTLWLRALSAETDAKTNEQAAIRQRDAADEARAEAEVQRDKAIEAIERAEQQAYRAEVSTAARALQDGRIDVARQSLARAPARCRAWEWSYLTHLADQSIATLRGHAEPVHGVDLAPDGMRVVAGADDGSLRVFGVASGEQLLELDGHESPIYAVACSPDAVHAASGAADMSVQVWNLLTGVRSKLLEGHEGVVMAVAYSGDGARLASGSTDSTIRVWSMPDGAEIARLEVGDASVDCLALNGDGTRLVSGSDDGLVRVWNVDGGTVLATLEGHDGFVNSVCFSADETTLASGGEDATVRLWDVARGTLLRTLEGHAGYVMSVAFTGGGARVVSGAEDNTIRIWDTGTGAELATLRGHGSYVTDVAAGVDGRLLASGSDDHLVKLWDAAPVERLTGPPFAAVAYDAEGRRLAAGAGDATVMIWDAISGEPLARLHGHEGAIRAVAYSADGQTLASGSDDRTVRMWNADTGGLRGVPLLHDRLVTSLAFSPDSTTLASGAWDGFVRVWGVRNQMLRNSWQAGASIDTVAYDDDGARIVTGASDGMLAVWDAARGEPLVSGRGHETSIACAIFSPDGAKIVSGSADATVRIWDAATLAAPMILRGHELTVTAVRFTPDGTRLVTASQDGTVRLWDPETGDAIATLPPRATSVDCLAVSPDGTRIASGSLSGVLRIRDSVSRKVRFDERGARRGSAARAAPVVGRLFDQDLSPDEVLDLVVRDQTLDDAVRAVARDHVLRRSAPPDG